MTRSTDSRRVRWLALSACAALVCAASLVAGARAAPAGINVWTSNGPPGGASALAPDPTKAGTLYAGGWYGVFKSTDAGGTWSSTNAPTIDGSPFALAIDPLRPHILYWAGLGDPAGNPKGVFKSTDAGATWSATGLTGKPVSSLAIDPITPSTLYAGTYGGGLFKSTDAGATWETANTGLPDTSLNAVALAIDPTNPTTLYAGGVDLFKSTDAGAAWSTTGLPGFVLALAIDPITTSTLYAVVNDAPCGSCQGVYKSTDAGVNWSATGLPWGVEPALALDPVTPRTLYVGTFVGVSKSNDGGDTWTPLNTGLMNLDVTSLAIDPVEPRRVYAGTNGGGVFAIEQAQVVGNGTPASCTEAALDAALAPGGLVTFDCGPNPVTITITSTKTIAQDTTIDGGGKITISGGNAVGVFAVNSGITFNVRNLTIADGDGGIANDGTLTLTNCSLRDNSTEWNGGGIWNGGDATLTNCRLSSNSARGAGGGIYVTGTLTLTNCTLSGNSAGRGGGIATGACGGYPSGCICGSIIVTNSTLSGNGADTGAGGIAGVFEGSCPTSVTNSIIANSSGGNCGPAISDGGHNLQFPGTDCGTTIPSLDPLLDPAGLKDNGGPTQTIALLPGSPAIAAGDETVCAAAPVNNRDQRGYVRPGVGHTQCSIGAYEADAVAAEVCVGDCDATGNVTVDEIITLVNIALGNVQPVACTSGVPSGATVDVAFIIHAVNNALGTCTGG